MGRISELINTMIQRMLESSEWTSAGGNNPEINRFIQANAVDNPDFEHEIEKLVKDGGPATKSDRIKSDEKSKENDKLITGIKDKQDQLLKGNVGKLKKFTSEQFGNVQGISRNPIGFIFGKIGTKLVRGGVVLGLILLVEQIVHFAIAEMMKPGRPLDRRLKIIAEEQVVLFTRRSELKELRQGFKTVFVTASPFIRGGEGAVSSNLQFAHGDISMTLNNKPHQISDRGRKTGNTNTPGGSRR